MIDKIVCLSLDKRYNEQERITNMMKPYGEVQFYVCGDGHTLAKELYDYIDVPVPNHAKTNQSYSAFKRTPGPYNAHMCYRNIIRACETETLLILEDDAVCQNNFDIVFKAYQGMLALDPEWEMFYLGANHTWSRTKQLTPNLLKINGSGCWHSVLLHNNVFQAILDFDVVDSIDGMCGKLIHPRGHSYAVWPSVSLPKPGFSYCEGREVNYSHLFNNKGKPL